VREAGCRFVERLLTVVRMLRRQRQLLFDFPVATNTTSRRRDQPTSQLSLLA
jgi:hypothetical protein